MTNISRPFGAIFEITLGRHLRTSIRTIDRYLLHRLLEEIKNLGRIQVGRID